MHLEGLEMIAVLVVLALFVKVLEQFGLFEPVVIETDSIEDEFEPSTVCHRPEGLEQLQGQTKFTKKELQVLYRGFKTECPSGVVNEETFKQIYSQFFPQGVLLGQAFQDRPSDEEGMVMSFQVRMVGDWEGNLVVFPCTCCPWPFMGLGDTVERFTTDSSMYAHFLFNAFDTDHNGSVSFENFVTGLSVILRGSVDDKLNWAFNLYDLNKDGCITREEMLDIMKSIYDMMGKYTYPTVREESPQEHVETFFQKMDKNRDGVVTIEEFIETCQKDENIMKSMQLFENVI